MYAEIQYSSNIENFERAKGTVVGDSRVHLNVTVSCFVVLHCRGLGFLSMPGTGHINCNSAQYWVACCFNVLCNGIFIVTSLYG